MISSETKKTGKETEKPVSFKSYIKPEKPDVFPSGYHSYSWG